MKQEYALQFIEVFSKEWAELGKDFELLLFKDIDASLFKARKLAELLVKEVYIQEKMDYPSHANQAEKNMLLKNEGIIEDNVFSALDRIRRMGNAAIHNDKKIPISDAFKVHHNLFFIVKWFVESYVLSPDKEVPPYQDPQYETLDEKVKKLLAEYIPDFLEKEEQLKVVERVEERELPTLHNSYLLYQLSKLRESSQEAVEGYQELSDFKKYMHVKRPIQDTFESHLQECKDSPGSKLIFLCGSVGDGKSHLLGYLSTTKPELISQFKIHNDATESFDPKKNSMDTLSEVLEPFSDSLIDESSEKLILAINLGVLHNFIESTYAQEKYQKLKAYIEQARVFESGVISSPAEHDTFKLVNFADYHSFELTKNGPISTYMSTLFERITKEDSDNPFYVAYQKDKDKFSYNPLLINFKMFSSKSMQQQIIQLIIKTIMKDKLIISSRELLNFVHDILVPAAAEELKTHDFIDMLPHLLPNLLFEGGDKSPVLKMLGNQDPIHFRTQEVDEKLVSLYNSGNYYVYYRDIIFDSSAQEWIQLLEPVENIAFLDKDTKRELSELLIRASFLYDSHLKESFKDTVYENYMKYLYAYNTNTGRNLLDLYFEVEKSIYLWKGSPTNGYLYLDDEGNLIRIAAPIQIKKEMVTIKNESQEIIFRFTPTLFLGFRCAPYKQVHHVEIDLPLYEMICKVLQGYRLNRKDREDSIQFIKFIDSLLPFGQQQEEILIKDMKTQFMFRLEYEEFFGFKFNREG